MSATLARRGVGPIVANVARVPFHVCHDEVSRPAHFAIDRSARANQSSICAWPPAPDDHVHRVLGVAVERDAVLVRR
eukprot:8283782-Pyramimonas_sp.AAC.1